MADFKETLTIRCTDKTVGSYVMTWAKYDLAQSDTEPVKTMNEQNLTLGDACRAIDEFVSDSLFSDRLIRRKSHIAAFLEKDEYTHSEEY